MTFQSTPVLRHACALLFATLPALAFAAPAAPAPAQALEGAWQLVSGEYVDDKGQRSDYASQHVEGIKVLGDGRFAFTTTRDGRFLAGGAGAFETDGSHYVESPGMASYPLVEGGRYRFSYVLDGDTWTLERHENGKRVELEVWQRVRTAR